MAFALVVRFENPLKEVKEMHRLHVDVDACRGCLCCELACSFRQDDVETGIPGRQKLEGLGLKYIADELEGVRSKTEK